MKVPRDPLDRMLQHIAHLAGLQMSKARKDQLVPLLGPGAVQRDRVQSERLAASKAIRKGKTAHR